MKVSTVSYAKLFNLGNYENERLEATVMLEDGDKVSDAMAIAAATVVAERKRLHGEQVEAEQLEARTKRLAGEYNSLAEQIRRFARSLPEPDASGKDEDDKDIPF